MQAFDPAATDSAKRWGRVRLAADFPELPGYEVLGRLGSGGMGSVWTARYLALNQIRAVKVLDSKLSLHPAFIERLTLEAQALGRLQHPNIVRVFDASATASCPYIAMEWVDGSTLSDVMAKRQVTMVEAIRYFEQIAAALDYAHNRGFVHRDIKPANIMITKTGQAMLIDFGIADLIGTQSTDDTSLTGTPRYMAPEIVAGKPAGKSSDIWALAVLIYRVLEDALPFDATSTEEVLSKIASGPALPARRTGPRIAKVLARALEKDPVKRYPTAEALVRDLKSLVIPAAEGWKSGNELLPLSLAVIGSVLTVSVVAVAFSGSNRQVVANPAAQPAYRAAGGAPTPAFSSLVVDSTSTGVPFASPQERFALSYPSGWQPKESLVDGTHSWSFSPPGRLDVYFRVSLSGPGASVPDLFQAREQAMAGDRVYRRVNATGGALVGGQRALSWEFVDQKLDGPLTRVTAAGVTRSDGRVTVETVTPDSETESWRPQFDTIKSRLQIRD